MNTSITPSRFRASRAFRATLAAGFAAILALTGASCMTTSGRNRGSLSDAMNKARDDNEGSRSVPDAPRHDRDVAPPIFPDRDSRNSRDDENDGTESAPVEIDGDRFFGIRGGISAVSSIDRSGDGWADLLAGISGDTFDVCAFAGARVVRPRDGSALDLSIGESLFFLRAGGEVRFLPFKETDAFAPYISVGAGVFAMFWQFQNPLYAGGDIIQNDAISGFTLSTSAGLYIIRSEHVNVALSVTPEVFFFYDTTFEGFSNDWFAPYGTISVGAEVFFK